MTYKNYIRYHKWDEKEYKELFQSVREHLKMKSFNFTCLFIHCILIFIIVKNLYIKLILKEIIILKISKKLLKVDIIIQICF